jgi:hypothetical protein
LQKQKQPEQKQREMQKLQKQKQTEQKQRDMQKLQKQKQQPSQLDTDSWSCIKQKDVIETSDRGWWEK